VILTGTPDPVDRPKNNRRTVVVIVLILACTLVMGGGALLSSYLEFKSFAHSQEEQSAEAAEARQKLAEQTQDKLCSTLTGLAEIKAPPINSADNLSRVYEQKIQDKLSELSSDVGCH
jgi:hypothetical protein